ALEIVLERLAVLVGAVEIALHVRIVDAGIKVTEVPFGQIAELFRDGGFPGSSALRGCGHDTINELERAVMRRTASGDGRSFWEDLMAPSISCVAAPDQPAAGPHGRAL